MLTVKTKAIRSRAAEARLDKAVRAIEGKGPESCPPLEWVSLREIWRLSVLYPERYVVFRDHFQPDGPYQRLIQREVLYYSSDVRKVWKFLETLSDAEKRSIGFGYIDGPNEPLVA